MVERVRGIHLPRVAPVTRDAPPMPAALASSVSRRSSRLRFQIKNIMSSTIMYQLVTMTLERVRGIEPLTQPWEGRV